MIVELRITVAWWLSWYIAGVALCARITGARPDMDKVGAMAVKAIKIK